MPAPLSHCPCTAAPYSSQLNHESSHACHRGAPLLVPTCAIGESNQRSQTARLLSVQITLQWATSSLWRAASSPSAFARISNGRTLTTGALTVDKNGGWPPVVPRPLSKVPKTSNSWLIRQAVLDARLCGLSSPWVSHHGLHHGLAFPTALSARVWTCIQHVSIPCLLWYLRPRWMAWLFATAAQLRTSCTPNLD